MSDQGDETAPTAKSWSMPGKAASRILWKKEDYWAIWLGILSSGYSECSCISTAPPPDMDRKNRPGQCTIMEQESAKDAPIKTIAWYEAVAVQNRN